MHSITRYSGLITYRQPGQGGDVDGPRDLRAELLAAEAAHFAKTKGVTEGSSAVESNVPNRQIEAHSGDDGPEDEDPDAKRRRILEETRDLDADSDGGSSESSDEDSDDEEDETAELMRELEKIKRERAEQKAKEVCSWISHSNMSDNQQEAEKAAQEQEQREADIALGNPLLNPQAFNVKRRWDDDVVFKNQARGTEQKGNKEFVNVCPLLKSSLLATECG